VTRKIGKAKSNYVNRVSFGGDAYEFHVANGYANLADVPNIADIRTAMGEAKYTEFLKKLGGVLDGRERHILQYRPGMSYVPEAK
jgi:hypothetical protein